MNLSFYIWILLPELISSPNLPNPALLYQLYHIGVNLFLKVWRINNILLLFCLKLKKYLVKLQQHKDKNTLSEIHSPHYCLSRKYLNLAHFSRKYPNCIIFHQNMNSVSCYSKNTVLCIFLETFSLFSGSLGRKMKSVVFWKLFYLFKGHGIIFSSFFSYQFSPYFYFYQCTKLACNSSSKMSQL